MLFTPSGKKSHIFARVGLTLVLVINLTLPVFASDFTTGSAFAVDERLLSVPRLASASPPVGSSTDPYYVRPFTNGSATVYRYSWSTTNPNGSSSGTNQAFTNFADIITHITSSIANSFLALSQRLHYDNDSIYRRLYDILQAIRSSSGDLGTFIPYFMPDSSYDFSSNDWSSYKRMKLDDNIGSSVSDVSSSSLGVRFSDFLNDFLNNSFYTSRALTSRVLGSSFAGTAYNALVPIRSGGNTGYNAGSLWADMKTGFRQMSIGFNYLVGDDNGSYHLTDYNNSVVSVPKHSLYDYFRLFGMTVSDSLGRLAYVLANDDDIALRQTQHDNMSTVTSDFTSGDVSVTPAKLGGLKSVGSALTEGLSTSASVSDGLSVLGSGSDAWDWFSDENAQAFDSVSTRSMIRIQRGSSASYLDQYYKDVMSYFN